MIIKIDTLLFVMVQLCQWLCLCANAITGVLGLLCSCQNSTYGLILMWTCHVYLQHLPLPYLVTLMWTNHVMESYFIVAQGLSRMNLWCLKPVVNEMKSCSGPKHLRKESVVAAAVFTWFNGLWRFPLFNYNCGLRKSFPG